MYQMKVLMLDPDGKGMEWMDQHAKNVILEELVTLGTVPENGAIPLKVVSLIEGWDYLLVFYPESMREKVDRVITLYNIPEEKVIWPMLTDSILLHHAAAYYMFDEFVRKQIKFYGLTTTNSFSVSTIRENLSFIGSSKDYIILPYMFLTGDCWAQNGMHRFYDLSHKYYNFRPEQVYFCDIGANIGTTCIYFKKILDPEIRIIAFEPVHETFRNLRSNCLINDLNEQDHILVQKGVSDRNTALSYVYDAYNPGASFLKETDGSDKDTLEVVTFDSFILDKGIDPKQIKYIWVDVEGYEGAFVAGAEETLKKIDVPVVMEFTPKWLRENNWFNRLVSSLKSIYSGFLYLDQPSRIHKIDELEQFNIDEEDRTGKGAFAQFDIFLLKHAD